MFKEYYYRKHKKALLKLVIIILILPLILPSGITTIFPDSVTITSATGIIVCLIFGIFYSPNTLIHLLCNKTFLLITFFWGVLSFSAIINNSGDLIDILKCYFLVFLLCFSFYICIRKNAINIFFDSYSLAMSIFIAIGLITIICFPNGIAKVSSTAIDGYVSYSNVNLFGHKNYYPFQIIPYISITLLNRDWFGKKTVLGVSSIVWCMIGSVEIVLAGSSTGILALIIFWGIYYVAKSSKKIVYIFINVRTFFLVYVALFISFVILNNIGGVVSQIAIILGKSANFTGRTAIWGKAIDLIKKHLFLGYGKSAVIASSGYYWYAHNLILDILIVGGLLALIAFVILIIYCFQNLNRNYVDIDASLWGWLAAFTLISLDESIVRNALFLYFLLFVWRYRLKFKEVGI